MGSIERWIRIAVGLVLLGFAVAGSLSTGWNIAFWVVGLIVLLTGILGYCPLWQLLGIDTRGPMRRPAAR